MDFFASVKKAAVKAAAGINLELLKARQKEIDGELKTLRDKYAKMAEYSDERGELMQLIQSNSDMKTEWRIKLVRIPDSADESRKQTLKSMYERLISSSDAMVETAKISLEDIKRAVGNLDEVEFEKEVARLEGERVKIGLELDAVREIVHN